MAGEDITIRIGADATGVRQGVQESQTTLQRGFNFIKENAAVAYAAAGYAALNFMKQSVQAAMESEQAQTALADAYKRFPALADTTIGKLNELADAQMKRSRFDDDAVRSSIAMLAQVGLTGKQMSELIPLVVDYAAKTGKDLPAAADVFLKALQGNGRGLKEVGIDFQGTGDLATDFGTVIDTVGPKVRGFAEVDLETTSGKMAALNVKIGELKEKIGTELIPIISDTVDALMPMIDALGWAVDKYSDMKRGVENMTGPMHDFGVLFLGNIVEVLKEGIYQFGRTDEMLGGLGKALYESVAGVPFIADQWRFLARAIDAVGDAAKDAFGWVGDLISKLGNIPGAGWIGDKLGIGGRAVAPAGVGTFAGAGATGSLTRSRASVPAVAAGTSTAVTINVHGNVGDPVILGRRILQALEAAGRVDSNRTLRRLAS